MRAEKNQMTADEIDKAFPNLADWVKGRGWIEIGECGLQGFVVRLLDEGGFSLEAGPASSLGEALVALNERIPAIED